MSPCLKHVLLKMTSEVVLCPHIHDYTHSHMHPHICEHTNMQKFKNKVNKLTIPVSNLIWGLSIMHNKVIKILNYHSSLDYVRKRHGVGRETYWEDVDGVEGMSGSGCDKDTLYTCMTFLRSVYILTLYM